jgi:hypothetical protein
MEKPQNHHFPYGARFNNRFSIVVRVLPVCDLLLCPELGGFSGHPVHNLDCTV